MKVTCLDCLVCVIFGCLIGQLIFEWEEFK